MKQRACSNGSSLRRPHASAFKSPRGPLPNIQLCIKHCFYASSYACCHHCWHSFVVCPPPNSITAGFPMSGSVDNFKKSSWVKAWSSFAQELDIPQTLNLEATPGTICQAFPEGPLAGGSLTKSAEEALRMRRENEVLPTVSCVTTLKKHLTIGNAATAKTM